MLDHAEVVSRATPDSGSPMVNLTRGDYCLPWKKVPQLRHIPAATPPGSSSLYSSYSLNSLYSFFLSRSRSFNYAITVSVLGGYNYRRYRLLASRE